MRTLIDVRDAAEMTGLAIGTLYKLARLRQVRSFKVLGSLRFDPRDMLLCPVLIGATTKSRKGTSWSQIKKQFKIIDPAFESRLSSGLSSGEGLIFQVRDPSGDDPGCSDKRLLVVEPEFAGPLRTMQR